MIFQVLPIHCTGLDSWVAGTKFKTGRESHWWDIGTPWPPKRSKAHFFCQTCLALLFVYLSSVETQQCFFAGQSFDKALPQLEGLSLKFPNMRISIVIWMMNHGPNGSLGTNILRQPHVKMRFSCQGQLPWRTPMVLLCSSVSSHSAAFRIEAVACLGPACLVSKEGDLFPTTPAGYKPNVKPQWNDKNWLPIFQECCFLLSTFEAAIAHSLLTVQISQTRQWHNGTHVPCAPVQRFCAKSDRYVLQYQKYWHRRC